MASLEGRGSAREGAALLVAMRPSDCVVREGGNAHLNPCGRALIPAGRPGNLHKSAFSLHIPDPDAEIKAANKALKEQIKALKEQNLALKDQNSGINTSGINTSGNIITDKPPGRQSGQVAGTKPGRKDDRRRRCHREVGVQVSDEQRPTCSMAELQDEDKRQIAAVLQQVLELSELNDIAASQLEDEKRAREELAAKAAALTDEIDGLRGKLGHALDLLRAYQTRVREMQQALVSSDQALVALQYEHKALLVRLPGTRAVPPTPPPKTSIPQEHGAADLSAAVESIAAALSQDSMRTPRESNGNTETAGKVLSEPSTQENTPAPQRPAPTPHLLDAPGAAIHIAQAATLTRGNLGHSCSAPQTEQAASRLQNVQLRQHLDATVAAQQPQQGAAMGRTGIVSWSPSRMHNAAAQPGNQCSSSSSSRRSESDMSVSSAKGPPMNSAQTSDTQSKGKGAAGGDCLRTDVLNTSFQIDSMQIAGSTHLAQGSQRVLAAKGTATAACVAAPTRCEADIHEELEAARAHAQTATSAHAHAEDAAAVAHTLLPRPASRQGELRHQAKPDPEDTMQVMQEAGLTRRRCLQFETSGGVSVAAASKACQQQVKHVSMQFEPRGGVSVAESTCGSVQEMRHQARVAARQAAAVVRADVSSSSSDDDAEQHEAYHAQIQAVQVTHMCVSYCNVCVCVCVCVCVWHTSI